MEFVIKKMLKLVANDPENTESEIKYANLLYAWVDIVDDVVHDIDDLYLNNPSAADFILKSMKKYGPPDDFDSNHLWNYGVLFDSLIYIHQSNSTH
jgi:hypothetical protein